jgi:hypothetical protein
MEIKKPVTRSNSKLGGLGCNLSPPQREQQFKYPDQVLMGASRPNSSGPVFQRHKYQRNSVQLIQ